MSTMDRRIERLEQQSHPNRCEVWCCANEADARALIAQLRTEGSPPRLVFVAGEPNSHGSPCWRIEGKTVAYLWCAIDSMSAGSLRARAQIDCTPIDPRLERMTDEQLLGVIAESRSTLVLHQDGSSRLLERAEVL